MGIILTIKAKNNENQELRARYDLTQEELAKKVGVRRETILFLEKGKYNPSLKLAHDIAKVLKSKIEEVFIFEDINSRILYPVLMSSLSLFLISYASLKRLCTMFTRSSWV